MPSLRLPRHDRLGEGAASGIATDAAVQSRERGRDLLDPRVERYRKDADECREEEAEREAHHSEDDCGV